MTACVYTIASGKGGTGKTTATLNLAPAGPGTKTAIFGTDTVTWRILSFLKEELFLEANK